MSDRTDEVGKTLERALAALGGLRQQAATIARAAEVIANALRGGGTLFLCGNGGSASQCQHAAAELTGRFQLERAGFRAIALTTDTSALTAIGNDYGFENVFARQVEALARPGDVLLGLSTSGMSLNVIEAFRKAAELGLTTIAFVGPTGGELAGLADVCIAAPGENTARIQECHLVAIHIVCELVERDLAGGASGGKAAFLDGVCEVVERELASGEDPASRRAVFLDRDGTIIPETGGRTADPNVDPLPDAVEAIRRLRAAGFLAVVVTNQAAIARGFFSEADLARAHRKLLGKFAAAGAPIDALYYCPHLPDGEVAEYAVECDCRKPRPGLLLRASKELGIDLGRSYLIGDAERDIQAGKTAGCRGAVLIRPDRRPHVELAPPPAPQWQQMTDEMNAAAASDADAVVPDILAAAGWVLEMEKPGHA